VPNQSLAVQAAIEVTGDKNPDAIYVRFYASADTNITASDYYLGQINLAMSINSWTLVTLRSTLPTNVPPGTYYVGWIIDPTNVNVETNEANNTAFHAATLLTVIPSSSQVLYVDLNAAGTCDGSSWENACLTLQDGLATAQPGCEIRVAGGVYTPDRGAGVARGDRDAAFELRSGVAIIGGYAGAGEADPDARDTEAWPTILSGDLNGNDAAAADPCDLWASVSRLDNSRHVVTAVDVDRATILDGVHIVGGFADEGPESTGTPGNARGAGLHALGGGLRLKNCVFSENWASTEGGGLYAQESDIELVRCRLDGNAAGGGSQEYRGVGGAVFVAGGSLAMINCSLHGNSACGSGGGIGMDSASSLSAVNCRLQANHADVQAGGIYMLDCRAALVNCTLAGNSQDLTQGAVVCGSSDDGKGTVDIANCILWDAAPPIAGLHGAAVTVAYSDIRGGWPGVGNLNTDPLFADAEGPDERAGAGDEDLRLRPGSLCIDAGNNDALPKDNADLDENQNTLEPIPLDLADSDRVAGDAVDLGAYEAQTAGFSTDSGAPHSIASPGPFE
jgi:hypothetical protein